MYLLFPNKNMLSKVVSQIARQNSMKLGSLNGLQKSSAMSSSYAPALKQPHMNDFIAPHEPFEVGYKRRQVRNNIVLALGTVFFALTSAYVYNTGVIKPYLTPPKKNLSG